MRRTNHTLQFLICSLIIAAGCLFGSVKLQIHDGRPVVDGVYVNGHGPYRFLLDTGATLNHLEPKLAESIGLKATFHTELRSATGVTPVSGRDGMTVSLGSARAEGQTFLFAGLDAVHQFASDIHGILGEEFLSRFDYLLDVRAERLTFGKLEVEGPGTRTPFRTVEGRPVVSTSLGLLVLDSGARLMVRFGVEAAEVMHEMITVSGTVHVGTISSTLLID